MKKNLQNHKHKTPNTNKGITLIALVITIIVLLILAGVAINMAIDGDGLFSKANEATEGWEVAVEQEEGTLLDLFEKLELIQQTKDEDASTIKQKEDDETVHVIQSIEDLVILANNVNTGTTYEGITFELEQSLDFNSRDSYIDPDKENFLELGDINGNGTVESLMVELTTGKGFIPIGKDSSHPFKGNIEGNNRTIYGLYIQYEDNYYYAGLIGYANKVTINNLSLKNVDISGGQAAAFIGQTSGDIICENLYCTGKIKGKYDAGALTTDILGPGYNSPDPNPNIKISNFTNEAELEATDGYAGAISSYAYYKNIELTNCTNTGNITATYYAAGLIAYTCSSDTNENVILNNCVNSGEITATSQVAGIIALIQKAKKVEIDNCKNLGNIINQSSTYYNAGLVGSLTATDFSLTNSCNEGDISYGRGGLISLVNSSSMESAKIENCYNTGNISSTTYFVGGIIGEMPNNISLTINNCYNTGNITSTTSEVAGILGYTGSSTGTISNCYNTGDIKGTSLVAGISARTPLNIEKCYNKGNINATNYYAAGIVTTAASSITVKKCYNEGEVTSDSTYASYVGGITGGDGQCAIENCYNIGKVRSATGTSGICGSYLTSMKNCYNLGEVISTSSGTINSGGLTRTSGSELTNSYNLGKITVPEGTLGVGSITPISGSYVANCYYLKGTYQIGIYDSFNPPDNSGERTETEIKQLMIDNLVSLDEWELGEDGYPKLVF